MLLPTHVLGVLTLGRASPGVLGPRLGLGVARRLGFLVPLALGVAVTRLLVAGDCEEPDGPPDQAKEILV